MTPPGGASRDGDGRVDGAAQRGAERTNEPSHRYCDRCGNPLAAGGHDAGRYDAGRYDAGGHEACRRARALEPPRYCPRCRRRMVVQVTPTGWTARCSEHGSTAG